MAGSCTYRNTGRDPTNDSGTLVSTSTVSCILTPALVFASISGPPGKYTDKDLQRATKLALELFVKGQEHGQLQTNSAFCKQPLKAWFSNLYYGNSYLDCYHFCYQCKNHFKTTGANKLNQIFFATLFLYRAII